MQGEEGTDEEVSGPQIHEELGACGQENDGSEAGEACLKSEKSSDGEKEATSEEFGVAEGNQTTGKLVRLESRGLVW